MRDPEGLKFAGENACAGRESAQSVLRNRATQLRRQAGQMYQEADRLEQLANVSAGLNGPAEEALWALWALAISQPAGPRILGY